MKYLKDEDKCKDAVMQIFENLISNIHKQKIEKFRPWLHVVTKNHCLLTIRSEKSELKKHAELVINSSDIMESTNHMYHDNEDNKEEKLTELENAIKNLNNEQRSCVELFFIQEKCYAEVVEVTGYSMKQVKSYIQNGKRNLANQLANPPP
jgi:RNA polymerase sigma-70 factor (ECF subfamily)